MDQQQDSTETAPTPEQVKTLTLQLAPLLIRAGLNVAVRANGIVEVRNPGDVRMTQLVVLRQHQDALWWFWLWSGATRGAPHELEPMVLGTESEEAARRISRVLALLPA